MTWRALSISLYRSGRLHRRIGASKAAQRRYPESQREYEAALASAEFAAVGVERPLPSPAISPSPLPPPPATGADRAEAGAAAGAGADADGESQAMLPPPPGLGGRRSVSKRSSDRRLQFQQGSGAAAGSVDSLGDMWSLPPAAPGERGAAGSARAVAGALMVRAGADIARHVIRWQLLTRRW